MNRAIHLSVLGTELRELAKRYPRAVRDACLEGANELVGSFIPAAIASSQPHAPIDRGQYAASFRALGTSDGAMVVSLAAHAIFVERGRGPGPVSAAGRAAIREWVARHGLADAAVGSAVKATGKKRPSKDQRANITETATDRVAEAIARHIEAHGIAPRWPVRRALHAFTAGAAFSKIIKRHLEAVTSGSGAAA